MKRFFLLLAIAFAFLSVVRTQASQVTWGAAQSNGIGDAFGVPLPNGSNDLILLGSFNISNAMITANAMDLAFLMSHFTMYGSSTIGAGGPINGGGSSDDGYWLQTSTGSTSGPPSIAHTEIYYWVFNSPSAATATQYGIFTNPAASTFPGNWSFPGDSDVPNTTITDLSEVPHDASGILFGSFGTGTSRDGSSLLYNLAPIPEPSILALAAFGLGLIPLARLRRRKS